MKAECPACEAYLSGVYEALEGERAACPSCGLPGSVMREVGAARKAKADQDLIVKYQEAAVRAGKAEAELAKLRRRVYEARVLFEVWERDEPLTSEAWQRAASPEIW